MAWLRHYPGRRGAQRFQVQFVEVDIVRERDVIRKYYTEPGFVVRIKATGKSKHVPATEVANREPEHKHRHTVDLQRI